MAVLGRLKMCVYSIRNTVNGKRYIGISKYGFNHRYSRGEWWNFTRNKHLKSSAIKHGINSFEVEILEHGIVSYEELLRKEHFYINKFNAISNGYNKTTGGIQPIFSEESCTKKSASLKEYYKRRGGSNKKGLPGKKHSHETRERLSTLRKNLPGHKHTDSHKAYMSRIMVGRAVSDETKRKLSDIGKTLVGAKNPNSKRVREVVSSLEFNTINELVSFFGISRGQFYVAMKRDGCYNNLQFHYIAENK